MKFNQLKINSSLVYFGKKFIVIDIEPPLVCLKRIGDNEVINIDYFELVTNPSFRAGAHMEKGIEKDIQSFNGILDTLTETQREKVTYRYELIRPLIVFENAKKNDIRSVYEFVKYHGQYLQDNETINNTTQELLIKRIAQSHNVSERTLKRYLSNFRKAENELLTQGTEGLIPKTYYKSKTRSDLKDLVICHPHKPDMILDILKVKLDEKYIQILKGVIERYYLTSKQLTNRAVYENIKILCKSDNLLPIKEITVYKILDRIDPQIKTRMRQGKKAAEIYDDICRGFTDKALFPLHIVEIDHTELDLDVIDEITGYNMGRPWITLGIDLYDRMVWCLYVSFEKPSINRVRKALLQGVFFKRAKERYHTENEWCMYGIPKTIILDNGPEFKSTEVRRMIKETLKSNVQYRPVSTPRYGGAIERLFGTINSELIHRLDGTRKSSFNQLGDYNPEEEAIYTLKDVIELLTRYITDIYHYDVHKGLPLDQCRPIIRYMDGLKISGYPEFIDPSQERHLYVEMLPVALKPYTRDGIRLDNVLYKSKDLAYLIGKRDIKYKVKCDDDDISKVYLLVPDSNIYVEIQACNPPAGEISGVNRYTYEKYLKILRNIGEIKGSKIPGVQQLDHAKAILQQDMQSKIKKNKKMRQQASLMNLTVAEHSTPNSSKKKSEPSMKDLIDMAKWIEENERKSNI